MENEEKAAVWVYARRVYEKNRSLPKIIYAVLYKVLQWWIKDGYLCCLSVSFPRIYSKAIDESLFNVSLGAFKVSLWRIKFSAVIIRNAPIVSGTRGFMTPVFLWTSEVGGVGYKCLSCWTGR